MHFLRRAAAHYMDQMVLVCVFGLVSSIPVSGLDRPIDSPVLQLRQANSLAPRVAA